MTRPKGSKNKRKWGLRNGSGKVIPGHNVVDMMDDTVSAEPIEKFPPIPEEAPHILERTIRKLPESLAVKIDPLPTYIPPESKAKMDNFVAVGHITQHLTGGTFELIHERTRINSWEELDYVTWKMLLGADLNVALYKMSVAIHLGCKISKDGESRKEDVDALFGLQKGFDEDRKGTGLKQATQALLRRGNPNEPSG